MQEAKFLRKILIVEWLVKIVWEFPCNLPVKIQSCGLNYNKLAKTTVTG